MHFHSRSSDAGASTLRNFKKARSRPGPSLDKYLKQKLPPTAN